MPAPIENIKRHVREIKAYSLEPFESGIKINQNENPFGMPASIRDEVLKRAAATDWARYPDFVPERLQEKLAQSVGWIAEGVMAGNGSNEMIQSVVNSIVQAGVRVVLPEPSFSVYRQVITVMNGDITSVPLNEDLTFNVTRLATAVKMQRPSLTLICSPNNPTGCTISTKDLEMLLRNTEGLVVVDQAYVEFGGDDFTPLLAKYPNLVILRTFSKAMAMGGLRVGYCLAAPELITEFRKCKMPYSLNFFSMMAAEVALDHRSDFADELNLIKEERERLIRAIREIRGLQPFPSAANFFVVRTEMEPRKLFDELRSRGLVIRDISKSPMLAEFVRISVGRPEENDRLIMALKEVFQ